MIKYLENKTIINGDTTIVLGEVEGVVNWPKVSMDYTNHFDHQLWSPFRVGTFESKGVSRPQNDDVYDKVTGKKVASRKAELQAKTKLLVRYIKVKKHMLKCVNALDADIESLGADIVALQKEINKF